MKRIGISTLSVVFILLLVLASALPALAAPVPGGSLDPTTIPKFIDNLFIPREMPKAAAPVAGCAAGSDYYEIALKQFQQQVLPPMFPKTTVWGYGPKQGSASWPAPTVEAKVDTPVCVTWINDLKDSQGNFLPPLFAVDQTLHWANPAKACLDPMHPGPDCDGSSQAPYTGPVPMVVHLHGAHVGPESDGFPESWFLPAALNIPSGFATRGSNFGQIAGAPVVEGQATFQYPNTQRAATLWFHDHVLGITRLNVYAGAAGFYMLRGGSSDLPFGTVPSRNREIPLLIQDRSFNSDGSLFFPDNRAFFEGLAKAQLQIPFIPDPATGGQSDVPPIWNPEFFGNTMTVNGKTWPYHNVEATSYRLRMLNGSNARTLIIKFDQNVPVWQIGADGGFLPAPAPMSQLTIAPAERADVIVDFTGIKPGTRITMLNVGPDSPFGGTPFDPADAATTGQVMQFKVVGPQKNKAGAVSPANLALPARTPLGDASNIRKVSLNELSSGQETIPHGTVWVPVDPVSGSWLLRGGVVTPCSGTDFFTLDCEPFGPVEGLLGTTDTAGNPVPLDWENPVTENPALGATEIWEIHNFTEDAHPIHLHQVQFEILERQPFGGAVRGPEAGETGTKDTVIALPGEITRIKARFDIPGLYVWHCHILDHEDNEMMRPYIVGP